MNPISRRSKNPATPRTSASPMKCSVSASGHTQTCDVMAMERGVPFNQTTKASTKMTSEVGHEAPGRDSAGPEEQRHNGEPFAPAERVRRNRALPIARHHALDT